MARDLRKIFEEERKKKSFKMREGHENRFLAKLEEEMPIEQKSSGHWLRIAASIIIVLGLGTYFFLSTQDSPTVENTTVVNKSEMTNKEGISLGDLSPDLQKIETYYVANINLELANLDVSDENKGVVDGYMERLAELDAEYKKLNQELNEIGPNDQTITALVKNLQLRLQLLQKLKTKLNQLKSSENEQKSNYTI